MGFYCQREKMLKTIHNDIEYCQCLDKLYKEPLNSRKNEEIIKIK